MQVDKKALYIVQGLTPSKTIIKSYDTPIILISNNMIFTSYKKYSITTTRHKNYVINTLYKGLEVFTIPHETLKEKMKSEGVSIGRM
jgi:hypothetical protein